MFLFSCAESFERGRIRKEAGHGATLRTGTLRALSMNVKIHAMAARPRRIIFKVAENTCKRQTLWKLWQQYHCYKTAWRLCALFRNVNVVNGSTSKANNIQSSRERLLALQEHYGNCGNNI